MHSSCQFSPASEIPLADLAGLYTRCFAGYPYPVLVTAEALGRRVRSEQIDLARSPLICVGGEPAGVALLGLRGAEANCAGFGVVEAWRGRGLAHRLLEEHLRLARAAGARRMTLMVLADNHGALRAYLRAGLRVLRDLLWLEWRGAGDGAAARRPIPYEAQGRADRRRCGGVEPNTPQERPPSPARGKGGQRVRANRAPRPPEPARRDGAEDTSRLAPAPPHALLDRLAALPRAAPFWQRDLPTLRALDGLEGWALPGAAGHSACALVAPGATAHILDLAAAGPAEAAHLIAGLQARYPALSINEPAESPLLPALRATGFTQTYLRHELELAL